MYKKSPQGWMKHWDFILLDIFCLQLAFVVRNLAHLTDGAVLASRERDGKPEANGISSREGVFG